VRHSLQAPAPPPRSSGWLAFFSRQTWRLAWRNIGRNPKRTAIVVASAAIGVCGGLLTMAFGYGTAVSMVDLAIASELGHLQVRAPGYDQNPTLAHRLDDGAALGERALAGVPGVRAWAPRLRTEGLVYSARASTGARIVGVDPGREPQVSLVARSLTAGGWLDGTPRRALVGGELAERLHVGLGDKLVLSTQDVHGEMVGEVFRVASLFSTPLGELDRSTVFIDLHEAQRILGVDRAVTELVVVADDGVAPERLRAPLVAGLGDAAVVETWQELQPVLVFLFNFFQTQAAGMYVAVFVAMMFGIANVLLMAVYERIPELGVLSALGMKPGRVVSMIVAEAIVLSVVGLVAGLVLGVGVITVLHDGIDVTSYTMARVYGVGSRIVPALRAQDFLLPLVAAVGSAVVASLLPVLRAARVRPAEAIRHV
jgi:ABC-type lipoprotein release transport system permease subunit